MNPIPSLEALGLTNLEALSYAWLVAHPGTTGYKVSKGIGKPTANVYRALESLERKGAVTNDRASPPLFRAVAPDELFDQLEREFMDRRGIAAQALASLSGEPDADEDGIFRLKNADQVMGRARILLAAAKRAVLLDATPEVLASLGDALDAARSRGVRAVVLARGSLAADHPDTIRDATARRSAETTLRMVADAREALIATLPTDGTATADAMWTRSPLFARTLRDAIATDAFYVLVEQGLRDGLSVDELEGAFERCREIRAIAES